jgi:hypothetical protein
LADFFPNWNFRGVFISFAVTRRKDQNPKKRIKQKSLIAPYTLILTPNELAKA